jgi:hypothetical protein
MVESYWDLYVAYIDKCVRDNWVNDIDPHHYRMEWNHFLPKSIFGDQPIGQWLTFRQHAIASALQSLAFKRNCLCPWHKSYLPLTLLELSWPYFCKAAKENGKETCRKLHEEKDDLGRSVHGVRSAERLHKEKDELGRSAHAVKTLGKLHDEKNEEGKSVHAVKTGKEMCRKLHEEKNEEGKSVHAMKTNSQKWICLETGFISTPGPLTTYQRAKGIDPKRRVQLS